MAAQMEQHRAPELADPEPEVSPRIAETVAKSSTRAASAADESKPAVGWADAGMQPLKTKPTTPGGSALKVETTPMGDGLDPDTLKSLMPKPSDGLPVPGLTCDSVSPVSPTVMKELNFDSRFISDAWSYEAPQNMFALLTQPTSQMESLAANGSGIITPYMQLQAQQQQQLQLQQQQMDQQVEHGLPLQMSPIHGSGLSSLYVSGTPLTMSPHHIMMQPQSQSSVFPTTPTAVNIGDIMISGESGLFLPNGSPTNVVKQMPSMASGGHSGGAMNVKDLTLNELRPHFNKPMAVVAKELGVCITLMKKICRRNGLVRWPHRRIRSLVNRITSLQVLAGNAAGAERKRFQSQIDALREELSAVIQNPNEKSRKAQADAKLRSPMEMAAELAQATSLEFAGGQVKGEDTTPPLASSTEETVPTKKSRKKKSKVKLEATQVKPVVKRDDSNVGQSKHGEPEESPKSSRAKKRKQPFRGGLHAHQPPPIKIPRHDELPSMSRLRSQSVPERRLRSSDRRHGRGRDTGASAGCERPSTTTHRNGRRGSISSILCDIAE